MVGIRLVCHRADNRRGRPKSQDWTGRGYGQRLRRVPSLSVFAHRRLALNHQGLPETRHIPRRSVHGQKAPKGQLRRGHDSPVLITTRLNPSKTGLPTSLLRNKNSIKSSGSQLAEQPCFENYTTPHVKGEINRCWPTLKVRLLERRKLDSFGRAKLDTLSSRKGRGAVDFQAISHWPGNRAPESSLSDYASMLRRRARQLAASKPGTCSEPMSQKNARHDRVCRIGTFLKDVEATVLGTNREPHGLLQRFAIRHFRPMKSIRQPSLTLRGTCLDRNRRRTFSFGTGRRRLRPSATRRCARTSGISPVSSFVRVLFQNAMCSPTRTLARASLSTPAALSVTTILCWNVRIARSILPFASGVGAIMWLMLKARHMQPLPHPRLRAGSPRASGRRAPGPHPRALLRDGPGRDREGVGADPRSLDQAVYSGMVE